MRLLCVVDFHMGRTGGAKPEGLPTGLAPMRLLFTVDLPVLIQVGDPRADLPTFRANMMRFPVITETQGVGEGLPALLTDK